MKKSNNRLQKQVFPFGGILLVIAGLLMLLNQFVTFIISDGIFLGALGLFFILWGATNRNAGLLIPGGILTGLSVGVFLVEDASLIAEPYQGGAFVAVLAVGFALITLLTRRVFNTLWVAIGIHVLHDIAFYLLPGSYAVDANLPDNVLDVQLGIFLLLLVVFILFLVFGRGLLKDETVGWS